MKRPADLLTVACGWLLIRTAVGQAAHARLRRELEWWQGGID